MTQKSKKISEEKLKAKQRLEEIEHLEQESLAEEKVIMDDTETRIKDICLNADYFCGVVLSRQEIFAVLLIHIESGESVSIPFKLYHNK